MAFFVNVIGPEFLWDENTRAFLRIEAAVRQYSLHSSESIYLIRRPLPLAEDHFAVLWPRGVALAGMYPFGGIIHGWPVLPWQGFRKDDAGGTVEVGFDNPYKSLSGAVKELEALLDKFSAEHEFKDNFANEDGTVEIAKTTEHSRQNPVSAIAIFTGDVQEISFREPIRDTAFSAMTTDYAIIRSAVHIPNILRTANKDIRTFSMMELAALAHILDTSARANEIILPKNDDEGKLDVGVEKMRPTPNRHPPSFILHPSSLWKWLVPVIIAVIAILFFTIKSTIEPASVPKVDSLHIVKSSAPSQSMLVISLPVEAELFVSVDAYKSRLDLDRALALGVGQRYLPDTVQEIIMDSLSLAKGAYGYFKVDNVWRKGKLLQIFQPLDTIRIVKFLDPLL